MTAIIATMDYLAGYALFGITYWILGSIRADISIVSDTGNVYTFAGYIWNAALVLYMVFGTFWYYTKLKEWDIER